MTQEPDQIDMMSEDELRKELRKALQLLEMLKRFPVAIRKMWSGGEVQQWINHHFDA